MKDDIIKIIHSWRLKDSPINTTESILNWINMLNKKTFVNINEIELKDGQYWFYNSEKGRVENKNGSFFSVRGIQYTNKKRIFAEQPIIYQPEIGFLGIICKEFDGVMYFLMQAKIEPGNINCVQLSPTIQATKSNFERAHGGKLPDYFYYFENSNEFTIIVDQIQSEQGTRFYKKRNRNIVIRIDSEIEALPNFKWMTLGQIKELMKIDNLVNADTRTVLSCIPVSTYRYKNEELDALKKNFKNEHLFESFFNANIQDGMESVYNYLSNKKMFLDIKSKLVSLDELSSWKHDEFGIRCNHDANFEIKYYEIEIAGREVRKWSQPLVKASGMGCYALIFCEHNNMTEFLVSVISEVGAFDSMEIGPTIFFESIYDENKDDITRLFTRNYRNGTGIYMDSIFSEEGGRFYHEQNRNVLMKIDYIPQSELPEGYFWMSYSSLNCLVQINNCLNIQLRNLLSIIDIA